jgi:transitional endoplasmic reticulum ATPase
MLAMELTEMKKTATPPTSKQNERMSDSVELDIFDDAGAEYAETLFLWTLRMLGPLRGYTRLPRVYELDRDEILDWIGLGRINPKKVDTGAVLKRIQQRLVQVEKARRPTLGSTALAKNVAWLGESLQLSEPERRILEFMTLIEGSAVLGLVSETLGPVNHVQVVKAIAVVLDLHPSVIDEALGPKGRLVSTGLLRFEHDSDLKLRAKLRVLSGLQDALLRENFEPGHILERFFSLSRTARLTRQDYQHVAEDFELLVTYITNASHDKSSGANILLHGRPGTGKTELARALAQEAGLDLYEVALSNRHGLALEPEDRLSAYRLAQELLARRNGSVILFDEIEEVFSVVSDSQADRKASRKKAWINRLLEDNPVPAFWIGNSIEQFDPAFLRRFDYVMELEPPARPVRRRLLEKYFQSMPVRQSWIERVADKGSLTPAVIERAARVVNMLQVSDTPKTENALERIMRNSLEVQGLTDRTLGTASHADKPIPFSLDYLQADCDLAALIAGMERVSSARVCLYGPPGTGKTALAHHLANRLGQALHVRRASDLLDRYVGITEQRIARMFRDAQRQGDILLLDEADSFLRSRETARQSWEVTQVNELLIQIESFQGIFIAATNLFESLDEAVLRRFDLKIRFDYLKPSQAWNLFTRILQDAERWDVSEAAPWQKRLEKLLNLGVGDFATVLRQLRVRGVTLSGDTLIEELEHESSMKPEGRRRPMGFIVC